MSKPDKMSSYGLYLQTVRVEKGISIEKVARETRIRTEILHAIEAEDHRHLPDDVFVKGFLKSFAIAIGADPDETLRRFSARRAVTPTPVIQTHGGRERKGPSWLTLLWIALLMIALVGLTMLAYDLLHQQDGGLAPHPASPTATDVHPEEGHTPPGPSATVPTPAVVPAEEESTTEAAVEPAVEPAANADTPEDRPNASAVQEPSGYLLEIVCDEDTWLKVIADDAPASEYFLKPGDSLRLEADTKFNLLIGNAGGVSVQFNGNPVPVPGGSGEVVNLELP
jgi:cytoskeletal protein RodZ